MCEPLREEKNPPLLPFNSFIFNLTRFSDPLIYGLTYPESGSIFIDVVIVINNSPRKTYEKLFEHNRREEREYRTLVGNRRENSISGEKSLFRFSRRGEMVEAQSVRGKKTVETERYSLCRDNYYPRFPPRFIIVELFINVPSPNPSQK